MITLAFDWVLGAVLIATAAGALSSRELFRGVVLFVVFGLLMALAWVRLQAPDLALAEAAIGAGLTGALLLDAIGHLKRRDATERVAAESVATETVATSIAREDSA